MNKDNGFIKWVKRYFALPTVVMLGVAVYMAVFSETSIVRAGHYRRVIDSLQTEININTDSMLYFRSLNERLQSDPEMLERVVREQYNMYRPNEDIYVFDD